LDFLIKSENYFKFQTSSLLQKNDQDLFVQVGLKYFLFCITNFVIPFINVKNLNFPLKLFIFGFIFISHSFLCKGHFWLSQFGFLCKAHFCLSQIISYAKAHFWLSHFFSNAKDHSCFSPVFLLKKLTFC
jgi:hypothetical protein